MQIPEVYTPVLERLLVVQMDSFPQYSPRMQYATCRSIIKVFVAMAIRGPVLWSFTSSVGKDEMEVSFGWSDSWLDLLVFTLFISLTTVHQGLIRVCSKPVPQSDVSVFAESVDLFLFCSYCDYHDIIILTSTH